jgi:hypothetical protein
VLLRRFVPVALGMFVLIGCQPSLPEGASSATINYVVFDPSTSQIALPNDLAWQQAAMTAPKNAQDELLQLFASQRGFPNDQEVPITIDVQHTVIGGAAAQKSAPPSIDTATLDGTTLLVLDTDLATGTTVPVRALEPEYVAGSDRGTLVLHNPLWGYDPTAPGKTSRRWKANHRYAVILRGGANGAKLVGGGELTAMPILYLLTQGVVNGQELPSTSLALSENQSVLPGDSRDARALAGAQLEFLRQSYLPVFAVVDQTWGAGATQEIVSLQTFTVAPGTGTQVVTDASAGAMPLPSDFLLDPANGGRTVVNNPAFGPLAAGIATLDGFSTTAMVLSQTSGPVAVGTVKDNVFLYDLSDPAHPVRVKEVTEGVGAGYVAEPLLLGAQQDGSACTSNAGCFSTAIGLQPATLVSTSPVFSVPALKEGTEYAVLVGDGVSAVNPTGSPPLAPLQPSTLGRILLFQNPLVDPSGKSQLPGVNDGTAALLEHMRQGVAAAAASLAAEKPAYTRDRIALGYTFRTQTITDVALQLAAAPYQDAAMFVPGTFTPLTAANIPVPLPAAQEVLSVAIPTLDPIDVQTGALDPDTRNWKPESLTALVIVPQAASVANSCPAPASALACAPLVLFQHGLGRSKSDVFAVANTLAAAGMVVTAIDAPLHGDRSYCTQDSDCTCAASASPSCIETCGLFGPPGLQGDAVAIGVCTDGSVPIPSVSGRFVVTPNFFRTRDAVREDLLDTSALVLALAAPPTPSNPFAAELASRGIAIDSRQVYWIGQSWGGILGALNTAGNPRISRAVLNVPGGTLVDVFTNSPGFAPAVNSLLASLTPPITPGTPEYLQFIQVAKWVLDPADPVNFARHLVGDADHPTLPDLLDQKPAQSPKDVFGQYAICDQTIPNPYNLFLFDQIGLGPTPATGANGYTAYDVSGEIFPSCTSASSGADGFLLASTPATAAGQSDAAAYLLNLALPANPTRP